MKEKILGIIICLLILASSVPTGQSVNNKTKTITGSQASPLFIQNNWNETQKLLASDGSTGDYFGDPIALYGNTALIGAMMDDSKGNQSGSAYIFIRTETNWTQQAKLLASNGETLDFFGCSVALYGDTALIGAPKHNLEKKTEAGSAYVFTRSGTAWTQQAILTASDAESYDWFGASVALVGDIAFVGAPRDAIHGLNSGSVYVFTRTDETWTQHGRLTASDGGSNDYFGWSVAMDKNTAVIGAPWDDNFGSVYVFIKTGISWTEQGKLLASDKQIEAGFGWSLAIDEETVLIGSYGWGSKNGFNNIGSAYVFTRSDATWKQETQLFASDMVIWDPDWFGFSVALYGNTAFIGSPYNFDNNQQMVLGSVYVFTRNDSTWVEETILNASDGEECDFFGGAIALYQKTAFIGARYNDDQGNDSGSIYVFTQAGENEPPDAPIIDGPAKGKVRQSYNYSFTSFDPEGDDVYYFIDWGDQTESSWIGPYPSGETVILSHTWQKKDTYALKAKARDVFDAEGDWGTLDVKMPTSNNAPLQQLFYNIMDRFPFFKQLSSPSSILYRILSLLRDMQK